MSLIKSTDVRIFRNDISDLLNRSGTDWSLRRYDLNTVSMDGQSVGAEVLFDPDSEEISITLPYNEIADPDRDIISIEEAEGTVQIVLSEGNTDHPYIVTGSEPSGTAPDRFWTFRLIKDRFRELLASGPEYTGRWSATQRPNSSKLTFAVESDSMVPSRSFRLPHLPKVASSDGTEHQLLFVKISASEFIGIDQTGHVFKFEDSPSTYYFLASADMFTNVKFGTEGHSYPSIDRIVGNIDDLGTDAFGAKIGLTPSSIIDISVSERAPVQVNADRSMTDAGLETEVNHAGNIFMYVHRWFDSASAEQSLAVPILTDMEVHTGTAELRTSNDDTMASIPIQVLSGSEVKVRSVSDVTGLYTEITIGGSRMMMPEGKLPYVGSAWSEYAVAQRSYDRENMTLAIQNAKSEAVQNTMMGIANGVLTGGLIGGPLGAVGGVASAGLNVAGTVLELQRNERTARAQQDMQEKMIMSSVGTAYNTGYGMEYLRKADEGRGRFQLNRPQHLTQARYNQYVQEHGYPDSGIEHAQDLNERGYIQGIITDPDTAKYIRDAVNRELIQGVRFV